MLYFIYFVHLYILYICIICIFFTLSMLRCVVAPFIGTVPSQASALDAHANAFTDF